MREAVSRTMHDILGMLIDNVCAPACATSYRPGVARGFRSVHRVAAPGSVGSFLVRPVAGMSDSWRRPSGVAGDLAGVYAHIDTAALAVHEAAHAVVAVKLGAIVMKATIVPDDRVGSHGHCLVDFPFCDGALPRVAVVLAGPIAENQYEGAHEFSLYRWRGDNEMVRRFLREYAQALEGHELLSPVYDAALNRACELVARHRPEIRRVAIALLEHETLTLGKLLRAMRGEEVVQ